ncbi:VQ motif-containing protein 18-like [Henckelia pumila]|uniref:VQ motif-containing protein 18-like n=1 Tax=Henckelia pumila TaxID=405737 RepID=UPI003C6E4B79
MNKNSQIISKMKPRIRIIHLFAPEIIEIDAANFREEVQRLTGKPADDCKSTCRVSRNLLLEPNNNVSSEKRMQVGFDDVLYREKMKGDDEISVGGFLGRFEEIELELMQEIDHKFPYMDA